MADYKRILIAVDLSHESALVLDKARALGGPQTELNLVHVMPPFPVGYMTAASFEALNAAMTHHCREALRALGSAAAIPQQCLHSVVGSPAREIHNVAQQIGADLIVAGSHGKQGFELLLGSTSSSVTHGLACDLLLVRIPVATSGDTPCSP